MIPFDVVTTLHDGLKDLRREPDGLLHCSSDLLGSLRHAQLRLAGAPTIASEIVSDIRMMTGTMWHEFFGDLFVKRGIHFQREINVSPGLPEGWGGTADFLFFVGEKAGAFTLSDLKTIKGEGMRWVRLDGAKEEHIFQVSAYWHALVEMGYPMMDTFDIIYLPMNDTTDKDEYIEPITMECRPIDKSLLWGIMEDRWLTTQRYLDPMATKMWPNGLEDYNHLLTTSLAPEMDRVQKLYWNGTKGVFELKLIPHWLTKYCPYPDGLCACNTQGTTKIGEFRYTDRVFYEPRKGYEDIEVGLDSPKEADFATKEKL